jgi:Ca-activated chloride channel family protein
MTFRFAYPAVFLLYLIPLVVLVLYSLKRLNQSPPAMSFSDVRLLDGLPAGWRIRFRHITNILRFVGWALLVVALARPQSGKTQEIIRGQGIDIVLALDISGSMAALDFAPQNRLEAAKSVIGNFIAGRKFDRIGLAVFAQDAFQQMPPTLDYKSLLRALDEVQLAPELGLPDGTAIGLGIASAANMLRDSTAASKVIILLTDGANNAGGIGPITAAQAVAALGMRVYTIGVGKIGLVPMPNAQMVESNLDESSLKAIADTTQGRYFRAEGLSDLQNIYDQIDSLERSDVEEQIFVQWQDQAFPLLWSSMILLVIERLLRQSVFQAVP